MFPEGHFPMPGDRWGSHDAPGCTVIASTWLTDERALVLLLRDSTPYYAVGETYVYAAEQPQGYSLIYGNESNIVPAVALYEESGGDY